ncbi:MAG TPA: hypothetical protein VKB59_22815, partial [Micromonosporaceae bacterium]|nr:hypothetical protein [Micromonosporaceae bacterium]
MVDLLVPQTIMQLVVVLVGAMATCAASLVYIGRVRLERPAIGVFNGRDVVVLFVFIVTLPVLYLVLPHAALTTFLILTFVASLSIGYRPVVPRAVLWLAIGGLLGFNVYIARTMLGTVTGWQLYWAETSVVVLLGATAVANLYVQGGMQLRHVAWFAFGLGFYDVTFSVIIPLTPKLADAFIGYPLDPSIGMRVGILNANIGIGDLLVYSLFVIAAYKAYGRRAATVGVGLVAVFGATLPALAPLILEAVTRGNANAVVPAQAFFGIPALITYLLLHRHYGRERTTREFLAAIDAKRARTTVPVSPAPQGSSPTVT